MNIATCPCCGFDLQRVNDLQLGDVKLVRGGAEVRYKGRAVNLTLTRRLIVAAIVRANGAEVDRLALAEAIGYEGDDIAGLLNVHISNIRKAFREIDPAFNRISRARGRGAGGKVRWVAEPARKMVYS